MTKRIITYPPRKIVYKNASTTPTTNSNSNEPPAWLRVRNHLRGEDWHYGNGVSPSSPSSNMRSASNPSGKIPAWIGTAMYGTGTITPESPSKEETERSLPYKYPTSETAKNEFIRGQIRSAAKEMNIATPRPYWLNDFLTSF